MRNPEGRAFTPAGRFIERITFGKLPGHEKRSLRRQEAREQAQKVAEGQNRKLTLVDLKTAYKAEKNKKPDDQVNEVNRDPRSEATDRLFESLSDYSSRRRSGEVISNGPTTAGTELAKQMVMSGLSWVDAAAETAVIAGSLAAIPVIGALELATDIPRLIYPFWSQNKTGSRVEAATRLTLDGVCAGIGAAVGTFLIPGLGTGLGALAGVAAHRILSGFWQANYYRMMGQGGLSLLSLISASAIAES